MRKFAFFLLVFTGAGAGVLAAQNEDSGLAFVLGSIGAVVGAAIGGAVTGVGSHRRGPSVGDQDAYLEMSDDRSRHFWLDHGRLSDAPGLPHADDLDPHSFEP